VRQHRCEQDSSGRQNTPSPRTRRSIGRLGCVPASLAALLALSGPVAGQRAEGGARAGAQARVLGRVVDHTTGYGIPFARVAIVADEAEAAEGRVWEGLSGSSGHFEATSVPPGRFELHVETLAYSPLVYLFTTEEGTSVDLLVRMVPDALELSPIVITTTRSRRLEAGGFFERRATGLGVTMDRAEIEELSPPRATDLFRSMPGVQVIPSSRGRSSDVRLRRGCSPQLVLNGAPFTYPISIDDLVNVDELEAVEVYQGATAGALAYSTDACGTIMVWTKQLAGVSGKPFAWRRLFAAAGLVTLFSILFP
jgi:hypothetical protein